MGSSLLQGHRVRLRPFEPEEVASRHPWDYSGEMARRWDAPLLPGARERDPRWPDPAVVRPPREGDVAQFIVEAFEGEPSGMIGTHDCDRRNGTFSYGIAIRDGCQRRGYGAEAILLLCRYYFEQRRYQKVTTWVYTYNEPSLRLHERLGFACEGCLRRMVYTGGRYYDRVIFGLTAEEFAERHTASLPRLEQ